MKFVNSDVESYETYQYDSNEEYEKHFYLMRSRGYSFYQRKFGSDVFLEVTYVRIEGRVAL
jgi:hypothetical protein